MLRLASTCSVIILSLLLANTAIALPIAFAGHSYDLISFSGTWADARDDAALQTFLGDAGYLVTITSSAENAFLLSTFDSGSDSFAWIGASDESVEGQWRWVVGPEAGTQFSQGATPTAPFNFANWGPVEPNNDGNEDFAVFNLGFTSGAGTAPGEWGDTKADAAGVSHYLVEYNVVPEPSTGLLLALGLALLSARSTNMRVARTRGTECQS